MLRFAAAHSPLVPPAYEPAAGGSNNWVVSGARTATGLPFLANDPHLATQAPAVWYVAHVSGGALDVIGATLPGTPAVVIGHNRRIAWGVTNMMSDVQDLFVEQVDEQDRVLTEGRWEPMRVLHETIAVRGAQPSRLRVRITPRGPLVSDLFDERRALALRWTGHDADDRTASAFFRINVAQSWEAFLSALAEYHLPMLNFAYADVDGNIGYAAPGALPLRAGDGRTPLDGSLAASHWRGYVPRDELPRSLNPARGFIASANNQVVDGSYPYSVSTSFDAPYRAARIAELLDQLPRATLQDMQRVQTDQRSAQADRLIPFLLRASPTSDRGRRALEALRGWSRSLSGDSAGAALFRTFAAHAAARLLADDLGPALWADYRTWSSDIAKALHAIAGNPESRWCDDVETATRESCAEILGVALESSLDELARTQGTGDIGDWRWDRQNHVRFPHLPFEASPLFRPFFSREVRRGGDAFTIDPSMPIRDQMLVASYRQIIDLSNLDASVFILPLGQSGHWFSSRYSDLLRDWNDGRYRTLRFSRKAVDAAVDTRLVLQPVNH
jgi:penicillin amidase